MVLAARGTRDLDDGVQAIGDEAQRQALKGQARAVYARTTALAVVGAGLAWLLPV